MALSILIIDDEENIGWAFKRSLGDRGMDVRFAVTPEDGLMMMRFAPDVVLLDYKLPRINGFEVLRRIREDNPEQVIIMMTAYGNVEHAVEAMKLGAFHYIQKPFTADELMPFLDRAREVVDMRQMLRLTEQSTDKGDLGYLDGKSPVMKSIYRRARKVADTPNTAVLILGESGTGKEMLARTIHELSARANNLFVAINCSAIPETLLESELFGYEPGAFTGALKRKRGLFEVADKGTVFLDEISDMPLALQAKILRVLEDQGFNRLGGEEELLKVDARVIAASNRNIEDFISDGHFREDLYYRLNRFTIEMPPLRDRGDDIVELALKFIRQMNDELKRDMKGLDPQAMRVIKSYPWPGNVRQLKNAIESAIIECEGDIIRATDMPLNIRKGTARKTEKIVDDFIKSGIQPLENIKRAYVLKVLGQCRTDQEAADALQISRRTITRLKQEIQSGRSGQNVP